MSQATISNDPTFRATPIPRPSSWAGWGWGAAIVAVIGSLSSLNYLLFHSVAELFFVVVACGIFIVAWHCRHWLEDRYLLCVGLGYPFVGAVHLLHTLAYKGMGIFPTATANLPTQLWIASRYLEAGVLLGGFGLARRRFSPTTLLYGYTLVTGLLLLAIFSGHFPDCYIEGANPPLTLFKCASEYLVILILGGLLLILTQRPELVAPSVRRLLIGAIVLTMVAGLSFTFYVSVYGLSNLVGHLAQIVSSYLIYKALVETGLLRPHELIYHNLAHSEAQLRSANAELAERARELESFALHIAHDLKSPLAAVRGLNELAISEAGPEQSNLRNLLGTAVQASDRMNELITGLLQLARVGQQPLECQQVDLALLARETACALQAAAPERRVDFRFPMNLPAYGDPKTLQVVLDNLLSNAWKFTRDQDQPRIELVARQENGQLEVGISDNGVGFSQEATAKLFRQFERLHQQAGFEGHGLGLVSVRRIIERHGGRVWADGHPGKGACFWFSLPANA